MITTKDMIRSWFRDGVDRQASHMVVACDTFDYTDYPMYSFSLDEAKLIINRMGPMDRVMEVYNLSMDMESQLNEHRAFNY